MGDIVVQRVMRIMGVTRLIEKKIKLINIREIEHLEEGSGCGGAKEQQSVREKKNW